MRLQIKEDFLPGIKGKAASQVFPGTQAGLIPDVENLGTDSLPKQRDTVRLSITDGLEKSLATVHQGVSLLSTRIAPYAPDILDCVDEF
jgi:hypothetical protein